MSLVFKKKKKKTTEKPPILNFHFLKNNYSRFQITRTRNNYYISSFQNLYHSKVSEIDFIFI